MIITPETLTASPDAGSNVGNGSDVAITHASDIMSKSSARNGGRLHRQGNHTGTGCHQ